jgi:predicted ArsR family transcriptional regulator
MSSEPLRRQQAEPEKRAGSRGTVVSPRDYDPDDPATWPGNRQEPESAGQGKRDETGMLNLANPRAMRALAHPVRMALLEILSVTETLTATQASEMLGESPANCAFHLRTLAKYGLVREAGGGRGRERPWTAAHRSVNISPHDQKDKQAELAALALTEVWLDRMLNRIRRVFARSAWPDGWADAVQSSRNARFLTPEETNQVADEIREILRRYEDRHYDPALRPAGALPVEFIFFGFPLTELSEDT